MLFLPIILPTKGLFEKYYSSVPPDAHNLQGIPNVLAANHMAVLKESTNS